MKAKARYASASGSRCVLKKKRKLRRSVFAIIKVSYMERAQLARAAASLGLSIAKKFHGDPSSVSCCFSSRSFLFFSSASCRILSFMTSGMPGFATRASCGSALYLDPHGSPPMKLVPYGCGS